VRRPRDSLTYWTRKERLRDLFIAFGGHCALCRKRVSIDEHYRSPYKATVDHIIPVSKGGGHGWDNLQLACFPCNDAKADRVLKRTG
jgi:5-methylcytosine-specific restriction endonuclease McrA